MNDLIKDISKVIDYIDKASMLLQMEENKTREIDIAIMKLQEAVFWLTFANEEEQ